MRRFRQQRKNYCSFNAKFSLISILHVTSLPLLMQKSHNQVNSSLSGFVSRNRESTFFLGRGGTGILCVCVFTYVCVFIYMHSIFVNTFYIFSYMYYVICVYLCVFYLHKYLLYLFHIYYVCIYVCVYACVCVYVYYIILGAFNNHF